MVSVNAAFNIARTGLQLQETLLNITTQNIAGQPVDAFKRQYGVAYDLKYSDSGGVGTNTSSTSMNPTGIQIGSGVQMAAVYRGFTQGESIQTGRALDTLIEGNGFYQVLLPDGTSAYTRVGSFALSNSGELVMPKTGYKLLPSIIIPSTALSVSISPQGEVFIETQPGVEQIVGTLDLHMFANPDGLKAYGDSMFLKTSASGVALQGSPGTLPYGTIKQAYREGSNVNAVEEMTNLIRIEKVYEMLTKAVKTGDAMLSASTNMVRG